jgi:hypothetical protein
MRTKAILIPLTERQHKKIKLASAKSGKTMKKIVEEIIAEKFGG